MAARLASPWAGAVAAPPRARPPVLRARSSQRPLCRTGHAPPAAAAPRHVTALVQSWATPSGAQLGDNGATPRPSSAAPLGTLLAPSEPSRNPLGTAVSPLLRPWCPRRPSRSPGSSSSFGPTATGISQIDAPAPPRRVCHARPTRRPRARPPPAHRLCIRHADVDSPRTARLSRLRGGSAGCGVRRAGCGGSSGVWPGRAASGACARRGARGVPGPQRSAPCPAPPRDPARQPHGPPPAAAGAVGHAASCG